MTLRCLAAPAVLTALSFAAMPGWADRPLVTNNADVHERAGCVVEAGIERAGERGAPSAHGSDAQLTCGVGLNTELGFGLARASSAGVTARASSLSGKTSIVDGKDKAPSLSIGYGVDWQSVAGGPTQRENSFVNGILSLKLSGDLNLHANLGWSHSKSARRSSGTWGLAAEKGLFDGIELLGEAYGTEHEGGPWVQIGARWAVKPEHFFVDLGYSFQATSTRPHVTTLGLRVEF